MAGREMDSRSQLMDPSRLAQLQDALHLSAVDVRRLEQAQEVLNRLRERMRSYYSTAEEIQQDWDKYCGDEADRWNTLVEMTIADAFQESNFRDLSPSLQKVAKQHLEGVKDVTMFEVVQNKQIDDLDRERSMSG